MLPNGEQSRPTTTDLRFSEILRRMDGQDRILELLQTTTTRIDRIQIENNEQLKARSEANTTAIKYLDTKVEHKDQTSIARDEQQVVMIRQEQADREAAMAERRRAHDADIAKLAASIETVNTNVEKLREKVSDAVILTRIILFITAGFVLAFVGGLLSGHIGFVITP